MANILMYSCLIIEDDEIFANYLASFIERTGYFHPAIVTPTGLEGLEQLSAHKFDLLFLDLNLPDINGLELVKAYPKDISIIATSSQLDYAVDCYDLGIVDFLLKPFDFGRFMRAIGRALNHLKQSVPIISTNTPGNGQDLYFKTGRRYERFDVNDILYIEAYSVYSKIHTEKLTTVINKRISDVANDLSDNGFIRIHKSFVVNVRHLKKADTRSVWINDTKLPVGVTYKHTVKIFLRNLGR